MKTCSVCGQEFEDRFRFCAKDGTRLQEPASAICESEEHIAEKGRASTDGTAGDSGINQTPFLFCPACEAEYPLTFSNCPVDGQQLTRVRLAVVPTPQADRADIPIPNEALAHASASGVDFKGQGISQSFLDSSHNTDTLVEAGEGVPRDDLQTGHDSKPFAVYGEGETEDRDQFSELASEAPQAVTPEAANRRRSHQIAARVIALFLVLLALVSLYAVYNMTTRRPPRPAQTANTQSKSEEQFPLIPTPQEARDYTEPQAPSETQAEPPVDSKEKIGGPSTATPPAQGAQTTQAQPQLATQPLPAAPKIRTPELPDPATLRNDARRIAANLVRARARRIASGFRYELTFTLHEQAGRFIRWNKLSIASRSSSGVNHVETTAFPYSLGPEGLLTFTVSVEMQGASESDWRGRVICTGMGIDDLGRPLRTSFGANVAP